MYKHIKTILSVVIFATSATLHAQTKECVIKGKMNKAVTYDKVYLRVGNDILDSSGVKDGVFLFVTNRNSEIAIIESRNSIKPGMVMLRKEAWCFLSPGTILITINALPYATALYSYNIEGNSLATEYEYKLRKPMMEINIIISDLRKQKIEAQKSQSDTAVIHGKLQELTKKCFGVPKVFICENPSSELSLVALKMMGKGDPTVDDGAAELKSLFNSLSSNIRTSENGVKYSGNLKRLTTR